MFYFNHSIKQVTFCVTFSWKSSMDFFGRLFSLWLQSNPKRLEKLAFLKGVRTLLLLAPIMIASGSTSVHESAADLLNLALSPNRF